MRAFITDPAVIKEKALIQFDLFHDKENNDKCLDLEIIDRLTDDEAMKFPSSCHVWGLSDE